jgi:putative ABC transport system permease protein
VKYLPLIWANFWRKRLRTIFTLASIVVAFILFGLLQGIDAAFEEAARKGHGDRLITNNIAFLPLPLASLERIEALPGVSRVSYGSLLLGAYYQQEKNPIQVLAVDPKRWFPVYAEWRIPARAVEELARNRTGAIIGASLARKYGWKVGDRVPIRSKSFKKDGSSDWAFDVVGIYDNPEFPAAEGNFLVNYDYFDEARADGKGTVLQYEIVISDRRDAANLSAMIDGIFANSSNPTRTQSEREMIQASLGQAGDVGFFVDILVFAVFFTLLFLTLNTMMQSVRERVPELAVLKTLGFTDEGVLVLVLAESLLMSVIGAFLGLAVAGTVFPSLVPFFGGIHLSSSVLALGAAAALALALISGLPSALRARGLAIVDALADR